MIRRDILAVTERDAAKMLSLPRDEFANLVSAGVLPKPVLIGGRHPRWPVADLVATLTGAKVQDEDFET